MNGKQHTLKDVPKSELGFICLSKKSALGLVLIVAGTLIMLI